MKKVFTLIAIMAIFQFSYGQSERMVLIEEGTNASCGPCAAQNPDFQVLIDNNPDNLTSIKYQVWWPGFDPMYEDNEADVDVRVPYYDISGAPTAVIDGQTPTGSTPGFDGQWYDGAPGGYSQQLVDDATAVPAAFDIELDFSYSPENITINATASATMEASGDLKFHIVVIEKLISWNSAPGSNGETEFHNVMKKMLPSSAGASMASSYAVGEEFSTTESWELENIYDYDEIAVVAFIQNDDNKEVLQAAYADEGEFAADNIYDAAALEYSNIQPVLCDGSINPSVEIRNNGSETLTSLTLNYEINDVSGSVEWTGSLDFFESTIADLGEITFNEESDNQFMVTLGNPNGESDENIENDDISTELNFANATTQDITIKIRTDDWAEETSWTLTDVEGAIVEEDSYSAGSDDNTEFTYEISLEMGECYYFNIYDSYGDGMLNYAAPNNAPYGYEIYDVDDNVVAGGFQNSITFSEINDGILASIVSGINETALDNSLNIFPNPTTDQLNVEFDLIQSSNLTIDLYNITGKLVMSKDYGTLSAGYSLNRVDLSDLNAGVYMLNITTNDGRVVRKVTVTK